MRGVDAEADQRGAYVVARFHGRGRVAPVVAEDLAPHRNAVLTRQLQQLVAQMVVERPRSIEHGDVHLVLARTIGGDRGGVVDTHHLSHILMQYRRRTGADFLEYCEQQVTVDR